MGRKQFLEPVRLGVKPCVCLGDPDRASGHLRASVPVEKSYASLLPNPPCQLWAAAPPSAAALLLRSQEARGTESA